MGTPFLTNSRIYYNTEAVCVESKEVTIYHKRTQRLPLVSFHFDFIPFTIDDPCQSPGILLHRTAWHKKDTLSYPPHTLQISRRNGCIYIPVPYDGPFLPACSCASLHVQSFSVCGRKRRSMQQKPLASISKFCYHITRTHVRIKI